MKERTTNRITFAIFLAVLILGLWMVVKSAMAQTAVPVCQPGDSTKTCLALLDQKSGQIDAHIDSTDKNVAGIVADLKTIDTNITQIKQDEAWERGIWGSIVSLLCGGFIVVNWARRKKEEK